MFSIGKNTRPKESYLIY